MIGQTKNTQRIEEFLTESKITIKSVGLGRDAADRSLLTAASDASKGLDHYVVVSNDHIFSKLPKGSSVTVLSPGILGISKELVLRASALLNLRTLTLNDIPEGLTA